MTREEAIKAIKSHCYFANLVPVGKEALDMAIEALEVEPCGDAISREAALMCMTGKYVADLEYKPDDIISQHIKRIKALPSVTPKQKTGEWIELKDQKPEALEDVLVKDIDGDVTCAYLCDDTDFLERFSGEIIDDVVEWMEIPG